MDQVGSSAFKSIIRSVNLALCKIPVWSIYLFGSLPAFLYFWWGISNQLGPNPISDLEHLLGKFALQLLITGLCITPLRRFANLNLLKFRRAIGLLAFFYVFSHLLVWLVLDVGQTSQIIKDIVKRPYITIGILSFLGMVPLAITSNNMCVRRLGTKWRGLHRVTYAVCLLGGLHFVMLRKGFQLEPLIYVGLVVVLLILRFNWSRARQGLSRVIAR
jgi:methionine sulfoxide reductase heme-binding subunit